MDNRFDKLEEKLDKIDSRLDSTDIILARQEANLSEHMRRSDNLETYLTLMEDEMKPIQKHVAMVEGALKFIGIASVAIGAILGLIQIAQSIRSFLHL